MDNLRGTVERQGRDLQRLAERDGYVIAHRFSDNDISAYDGSPRPGFGALCDVVARGEVDVVLAVHSDRLWRRPADREAFLALAGAAGLTAIATSSGVERIGNVDDEFGGDMLAILAKRESATIARRMRAKHLDKAERGLWGGGPAPFGYDNDPEHQSLTINEVEASTLRSIAGRLAAGEGAYTIAAELHANGVTGRNGGRLTATTIRSMVTCHTVAGIRTHHGAETPAVWPAIIDVETWQYLRQMTESRRRGPRAAVVGRFPLSGIATTTEGVPMTCTMGSDGTRVYRADGVTISQTWAEELVAEAVAEYLDGPELAAAVRDVLGADTEAANLGAALVVDRGRLSSLPDLLADGTIDAAEFRQMKARLTARIEGVESQLAARRAARGGAAAAAGLSGDLFRQAWPDMTNAERRDVVELVTGSLTVAAHTKRGPRRQPERLAWRGRW